MGGVIIYTPSCFGVSMEDLLASTSPNNMKLHEMIPLYIQYIFLGGGARYLSNRIKVVVYFIPISHHSGIIT